MKILKGRYEPVLGLSPDLTAIITRCLAPAAARRPSAERLLSLPAVRARAAELGIELPPVALAPMVGLAPPTPGAVTVAEVRAGWRPQQAQLLRRKTCPGGAAEHPHVGRRSDRGLAAQPEADNVERPLQRKPPLAPAAVPLRRRTVQAGAVARHGPPPPTQEQPAEVYREAGAGQHAEAAQPTGSPSQPSPRRHSHFSVQHHLSKMSGAAQQWLARPGSNEGAEATPAAAAAAQLPAVKRSARSDSSLGQLRQARWAEQVEGAAAAPAGGSSPGAKPRAEAVAAPAAPPPNGRSEEERGALEQLRQRCSALLGSEALFLELHGAARAAVDGGVQEGAGPTTLAALGDLLFARVGYSGRAAEALHLLLKVLYYECE
jgi:hypothetical protein